MPATNACSLKPFFHFFSLAIDYPDHLSLDILSVDDVYSSLLRAAEEVMDPELATAIQNIRSAFEEDFRSFPERDRLLLELQKDYTRLFFASRPRLVYLWESVYKTGRLMQEPYHQVVELYRRMGFDPDTRLARLFNLPEDDLATEMRFASHLCDIGTEEALSVLETLVTRHLRGFVRPFAERLGRHARMKTYKALGEALLRFSIYIEKAAPSSPPPSGST